MTIEFYRKNVYGNELMYLVDEEKSVAILQLIGQKTISKRQMDYFKILGLEFTEVLAPKG